MTSVTFTPLSGALGCGPPCYLLEIDDCTLLLDCGWDMTMDTGQLELLEAAAERVDAVLISHASIAHIGALPYAVEKLGLTATVYATLPVCKMGQMTLYDMLCNGRYSSASPSPAPFDLDAVDRCFLPSRLVELKFSEKVKLRGGVTVEPLAAGHTLGGAFWRISKGNEDIVYAPVFNHQRERHLPAAALGIISGEGLPRPSLLISSAQHVREVPPPRKTRDGQLLAHLAASLRDGADVLLPVDSSGRVLELLLVLQQAWKADRWLARHPLVLLHHTAANTIEFAKSHIEWMSDEVVSTFDSKRENAFAFRHVTPCCDLSSLAQFGSPKVVLASSAGLESGFAARLFPALARNPRATLLLTQPPPKGSPAESLAATPTPSTVTLKLRERVGLIGDELREYERERRRRLAALAAEEEARAFAAVDESEVEGLIEAEAAEGSLLGDAGFAAASQTLVQSAAGGGEGGGGPLALQRRRHVMLPYADSFRARDEWGEQLSEAEWAAIAHGGGTRTAVEFEAAAESAEGAEGGAPALAGEEALAEEEEYVDTGGEEDEGPFKWREVELKVQVRCRVRWVGMGGYADGRSLKALMSQLNPLKLALVGASGEDAQLLKAHVEASGQSRALPTKVFVPKEGEQVNGSSETALYRLKLSDELIKQLRWASLGPYEVAHIHGRVRLGADAATKGADAATKAKADEATGAKTDAKRAREAGAEGGAEAGEAAQGAAAPLPPQLRKGVLGVLEPLGKDERRAPKRFLSLGEPRLADLKQRLGGAADGVELSAGQLLVHGGAVALRKPAHHSFVLEGAFGSDYLRVRKMLYEQLTVL